MSIQAHVTNTGEPIPTSAICSECEGDAGLRIMSWKYAKDHPDYNRDSRVTVQGLKCIFCGKRN